MRRKQYCLFWVFALTLTLLILPLILNGAPSLAFLLFRLIALLGPGHPDLLPAYLYSIILGLATLLALAASLMMMFFYGRESGLLQLKRHHLLPFLLPVVWTLAVRSFCAPDSTFNNFTLSPFVDAFIDLMPSGSSEWLLLLIPLIIAAIYALFAGGFLLGYMDQEAGNRRQETAGRYGL